MGYWWCPNCREEVDSRNVTFQEKHENCGHSVDWIEEHINDAISELKTPRWETPEQTRSGRGSRGRITGRCILGTRRLTVVMSLGRYAIIKNINGIGKSIRWTDLLVWSPRKPGRRLTTGGRNAGNRVPGEAEKYRGMGIWLLFT
jgi:hypothetical protein